MEPGGAVTVSLGFTDVATGKVAQLTANARAVVPEAAARLTGRAAQQHAAWVDPLAAIDRDAAASRYAVLSGTGQTRTGQTADRAGAPAAAPVEPLRVTMARQPGTQPRIADARATLTQAAGKRVAMMSGGVCSWGQKKRIWATVGTSYPKGKSKLDYSSDTSSTFGVGTTFGDGWSQTSTESTGDSWGQGFVYRRYNRSFRVQVDYQKQHCYLASSGTYSHSHAIPRGQPGYNKEHKLDKAPKFTHCGPVSAGHWWRGKVRGADYQLSYGVKAASWLGITMSSRRAYSRDSRLTYYMGKKRRMCGSNDDAATARTVRERLRK